jgi:predicted nucleotidyltransferase
MFIRNVIQALQKYEINYALIGGYAVALHGAIRGTVDIDIVVSLTRKSLQGAERALKSIGLKSHLPITAADIYQFREEYIKKRNLAAWSFNNADNPLEVVDILITEDVKQIKTVIKEAFGVKIRVAAIPDLIALKTKSGRPQDKEDIKALKKLQ